MSHQCTLAKDATDGEQHLDLY